LRGINVGGKNIIPMGVLRSCLEGAGLTEVQTYIQSGNALFRTDVSPRARLTRQLEKLLSERFGYVAAVVVRSAAELRNVVVKAPAGFGSEPGKYRYDVLFLMDGEAAPAVLRQISLKEGVDTAYSGRGVVYFRRLTARAAQSHLSRLVSLPVYKRVTVRNWNTTTRLAQLLDGAINRGAGKE
jgi:uncharacterized protein (DUF1697 family)